MSCQAYFGDRCYDWSAYQYCDCDTGALLGNPASGGGGNPSGGGNCYGGFTLQGQPCGGGNSGGGGFPGGTITTQPSGVQMNSGIFSQTLQGILSSIALFQHAPYVPTGVQPQQQPVYYPNQQGQQGVYLGASNNTLGSFQNFVTKNSGAALLVVLGLGLFLLKPPSRAR